MKVACPHCKKNTIPLYKKAFAGSLTRKGVLCPSCGNRCVNGIPSTIFKTALRLVALIIVIVLTANDVYIIGNPFITILSILAVVFVLEILFDAILGKLVPSIHL